MRKQLALVLPAALLVACFTGSDDDNAADAGSETGDGDGDDDPGVCGDGVVDPGEECDDGNGDNTDACLSSCVAASCGDAVIRLGVEECEDGNSADDDACLNTCQAASCGDGFVWVGTEVCDDGNQDDGDACPSTCEPASCGDGFVWAGNEDCDDANSDNTDACVDGCVAASCGDGFLQAGTEQCEDGNAADLDGCSAACGVELYSRCEGVGPGSCAPIDILVLVASEDVPAFRDEIAAITGGVVDYFDGEMLPPPLAQLESSYDCIYTHANVEYADPIVLSDRLVSFVDNGGNVVLGIGTGLPAPYGFAGTTLGGVGYSPVTTGEQVAFGDLQTYAGDGVTVLHQGVESYTTGIYDPEITLQGDGLQDASYDSGILSVAHRPDFKVVYLNGTGMLFGQGDWARLAANACAAGFVQ